ncbi:hypothetical protein [Jiella pacifica]|uniref:Uncharacterized protein n=1 Tax=Jiella pacifica TaxID=2696469 RepID=A0A6N9T306_9HYPH|nr:hypothetical protein [Jiella pacifica]NDW05753.1 hypothetical protein [Jiella pacifica]
MERIAASDAARLSLRRIIAGLLVPAEEFLGDPADHDRLQDTPDHLSSPVRFSWIDNAADVDELRVGDEFGTVGGFRPPVPDDAIPLDVAESRFS